MNAAKRAAGVRFVRENKTGEKFMKRKKCTKRLAAAVLSGVLLAGAAGTALPMSSVQAE